MSAVHSGGAQAPAPTVLQYPTSGLWVYFDSVLSCVSLSGHCLTPVYKRFCQGFSGASCSSGGAMRHIASAPPD